MSKSVIAQVELTLDKSLQLPACSEMEVMIKASGGVAGKTWILETSNSTRSAVAVTRAIAHPNEGKVLVLPLNPRDEAVTMQNGAAIALMDELEEPTFGANAVGLDPTPTAIVPNEKQEALWDMVAATRDLLDSSQQKLLLSLLLEFADVFALNSDDFGRAGTVSHRMTLEVSHPSVSRFAESHSSARKRLSSCFKTC